MATASAPVRGISPVVCALAAALSCAFAGDAVAADWQFNPQVELGALANDNYRMNLPPLEQSVFGAETDVQAQLRSLTDLTDFRFTPELRATYFPSGRKNDETDPFLTVIWNQRGQRLNSSLYAEYSEVSVVQNFSAGTTSNGGTVGNAGSGPGVAPGGLGNPTTGESGFINVENRQKTVNIMPSADFEYSPHLHFQATANYADVRFNEDILGTSVGFKTEGGTLGVAQDLNPRDSLALRAIFSHNEPATTAGGVTGSNSYGGVGEWTRHISEISQAYIRIGDEVTRFGSTSTTAEHNQNTWVAGGGFIWAYQVTKIFLDLTHTVDPSVTGYTVSRDQARLQVTRDFSARLRGVLGVNGLKDSAVGNAVGFDARKYALANVGFEWRYARAWTLKGGYNYTRQHFQADSGDEISNQLTLSVVYQPNRDRK